jgi:exonuclease SbcD
VRFLHTADWHVGKVLRGRARLDEQRQVLAEIVAVAREHPVDAVLICGDLYDSATPTAESQRLVVRTLLDLRATGAEVIAIAGNHDPAPTFEAYRPLAGVAGLTLAGRVHPAADGGVVSFTARSTGERVNVALIPFLSQRYAVTAAQLVAQTPAESAAGYDAMFRVVLNELCAAFTPGAVNLVMAHVTVTNAVVGGGERAAQTIFEFHVPATAFPVAAHYVALGHLHRAQRLPAPCPVQYSGAPFGVDFGEQDNRSVVLLVDATPTTPAKVTELTITSARTLRTVTGTLAELTAAADDYGSDLLRVVLREPSRAGLTDAVRDLLPNVLDIRIDPEFTAPSTRPAADRAAKAPGELLDLYCTERGITDPRLRTLFEELLGRLDGGIDDSVAFSGEIATGLQVEVS